MSDIREGIEVTFECDHKMVYEKFSGQGEPVVGQRGICRQCDDERIRTAERSVTNDGLYERVSPAYGAISLYGEYLSGLADGEGCFAIARANSGRTYRTEFLIHLRADDRPLLEWLRSTSGLGAIHIGRREKQGTDQPSFRWVVNRKDECLRLVALFETYRLRSKKRKDFKIWADATRAWARQDFGRMAELHDAIKAARLFESAGDEWVFEPDPQLALEEA